MSEGKKNLNEVGAAWLREGRNGKFYSITLQASLLPKFTDKNGNVRLMGFKNNFKTTDKHPDMRLIGSIPIENRAEPGLLDKKVMQEEDVPF